MRRLQRRPDVADGPQMDPESNVLPSATTTRRQTDGPSARKWETDGGDMTRRNDMTTCMNYSKTADILSSLRLCVKCLLVFHVSDPA